MNKKKGTNRWPLRNSHVIDGEKRGHDLRRKNVPNLTCHSSPRWENEDLMVFNQYRIEQNPSARRFRFELMQSSIQMAMRVLVRLRYVSPFFSFARSACAVRDIIGIKANHRSRLGPISDWHIAMSQVWSQSDFVRSSLREDVCHDRREINDVNLLSNDPLEVFERKDWIFSADVLGKKQAEDNLTSSPKTNTSHERGVASRSFVFVEDRTDHLKEDLSGYEFIDQPVLSRRSPVVFHLNILDVNSFILQSSAWNEQDTSMRLFWSQLELNDASLLDWRCAHMSSEADAQVKSTWIQLHSLSAVCVEGENESNPRRSSTCFIASPSCQHFAQLIGEQWWWNYFIDD